MREANILVIGGGIAGLTAAIEAAEVGYDVFIVEKEPYLGGRVAAMNKYFPKLCPPYCGLEINFSRIKNNSRIKLLTLANVTEISGQPGDFNVAVTLNPRYVELDKCTACNECVAVCPVERLNEFNLGMDLTKAIYLPHIMALPTKYVIDDKVCLEAECAKCVKVCRYDAINLGMEPETIQLKVGSIVLTTGWEPYDATKIDNLGFGKYGNVLTNIMMERLASIGGPTRGQIIRPTDGKEVGSIAFVQCAGSRDENHLPYCSAVCCLASLKEAIYVRDQYPDSKVYIFYIDMRTPGIYEDFYQKTQSDESITFVKGKVSKIEEDLKTKDLIVEADNILLGEKIRLKVDMVVLATGMVPVARESGMTGADIGYDEYGFTVNNQKTGIYAAGVVRRPMDVASSVRSGAGAALKAIQCIVRK